MTDPTFAPWLNIVVTALQWASAGLLIWGLILIRKARALERAERAITTASVR